MRLIALPIVFFLICCLVPLCPAQAKPGDKTISIVVTDKVTGEALSGAEVGLSSQEAQARIAHTDDFGQCAVDVPAGVIDYLRIAVKKTGYATLSVGWRNLPSNQQLPAELDFAMGPGVRIGGKVVDENGKPVSGATIHLVTFGGKQGQISPSIKETANTDSAGKWVVDDAPIHFDGQLDYNISGTGLLNNHVYESLPPYAQLRNRSAVIVVKHALSMSGTVLGADGHGVAGAVVRAGTPGWYNRFKSATADADGHFTLSGLGSGALEFVVQSRDFEPQMVHVTLPTAGPVEIHMQAGQPLRLHVINKSGNPIRDARISVYQWHNEPLLHYKFYSDAHGNADWPHAPGDEITYNITAPAMGQITGRALSPTTRPITITLGPKTQIHGTVVDAATGAAIKKFKIISGIGWTADRIDWHTGIGGGPRSLRVGHDGKFTYSIPSGADQSEYPAYALRIEAKGYLPAESRAFADDEGQLPLTFKLVKGKPIAGIVYSPDHKPVAGVDVYLVEPNQQLQIYNGRASSNEIQSVQTDSNGRFSFPPESTAFDLVCLNNAGFAELDYPALEQATAADKPSSSEKVILPTTRPSSYDLSLQKWAQIQGTYMIGSKPGANVKLVLSSPGIPWKVSQPHVHLYYDGTTSSEGKFKFTRVPPREMEFQRIIDTHNGGRCGTSYSPISIKPGQKLTVHLGGSGRAVVGQFDLPGNIDKQPLMSWFPLIGKHQAHGTPDIATDQVYAVIIQPDGHFRADDVPAGTYDLIADFYPESVLQGGGQWHPVASARTQFTVPPMPGGRSDKPLDLGTIPVTPGKK